MSNNYQQLYNKPRPADQRPPPFATKTYQQSSSYFPPSYNKGNSSSSDSAASSSLPTTPQILLSNITTTKNDGYDSDSSEEGRKPSHPQLLGLRVVNPDNEEDEGDDTTSSIRNPTHTNREKKDEGNNREPPIMAPPISLDQPTPPSETQWKVYQQQRKPELLPHRLVSEDHQNSQPDPSFASPPSIFYENVSTSEYASTTPSKYAKVSYHLTNDPSALKKYRDMAEKTNDTTTQLMFAKYLLETADAFHSSQHSSVVVGSMWGMSSTTNKSQQPEPYLIVPSPPDTSSHYSTSSLGGSSNNKAFEGGSVSKSSISSLAGYQQQSLMHVTMKQQASLKNHRATTTTTDNNSDHNQKRRLLEQEGIKWIIKLAKQNVPEACYMQASWMDKEMYGFKNNMSKSIALHQVAAKANIPESLFAIAEHQEEKGDAKMIVKFYQVASDYGYVNAIYKLSFLTIHGKLGIRQNLTEGLRLMYKACTLASEEFNVPPYTFALMLTNEYEQVDFPLSIVEPYGGKEAAILYYERAARLNNNDAQSKLGSIYEHGLYGESMNFARAFDFYEQAALNSSNSKAMLGLCRLNNQGSHGPGDRNQAVRLENDVSGWLAATPVNEDLSFSWCEKAAKAGNVDALALLGWFYECGFGIPRDFGRAETYYTLAAEKGDVGAKSRLLNTNKSITKQQHEAIVTTKSVTSAASKKKKGMDDGRKQNHCKCM